MNRRRWLLQLGALGMLASRGAHAADASDSAAAIRAGWQRFLPANHGLSLDLTPIKRPLKDWSRRVPAAITMKNGRACLSAGPASCRCSPPK